MAGFEIDEDVVLRLATLLDQTGLTEIEYRIGEKSLRVARSPTVSAVQAGMQAAPAAPGPVQAAPAGDVPREGAVTAPMVGVVYLAPEPESPPFVKVGDAVTEGQTLLLIEAMKTFNPVRAPRAGQVIEILVSDKTPVEFGEELVVIG